MNFLFFCFRFSQFVIQKYFKWKMLHFETWKSKGQFFCLSNGFFVCIFKFQVSFLRVSFINYCLFTVFFLIFDTEKFLKCDFYNKNKIDKNILSIIIWHRKTGFKRFWPKFVISYLRVTPNWLLWPRNPQTHMLVNEWKFIFIHRDLLFFRLSFEYLSKIKIKSKEKKKIVK